MLAAIISFLNRQANGALMKFFKFFLFSLISFGGLYLFLPLYTEAQSAANQQGALIPRKFLFGNPVKTAAKLSPDGTQMAYLAPNEKNVLNVWVIDLKKGAKERQVTTDRKRGIRDFLWQFDSAHILYLQDRDGDENHHVFQTDIATLETKDLTPYEKVKVGLVDAEASLPDEMLIQMNRRNPDLFDIYRLNLKTGDLTLDTENPGGVIHWVADHQLQIRVSQSYAEDGSTVVRVRDDASKPWRDFLTFGPLDTGDVLGFSADNQSLYVITNLEANTSRLLKIELSDGKSTLIAEDPDFDLSSVKMHPTTHELEVVGVERERHEWMILDPQLQEDFNFLQAELQGPFSLASRDLSNQNWIVVSQSDVRPAHFYSYRRNSKDLSFLFSTQPTLEQYPLSPMKPIKYQARDGMTLHGYLTLPYGLEPRNLPTVLLVHGGPWTRDSWGLNSLAQWLSNRGYAVLQINYRGSTGYGKAYLNAGDREWANKMHHDLLDGKEWLVNRGIADAEKVAIFGGSYGGYATLVGLSFTPDAFCCGVDIVGPSNLITLLQTFPPYWNPLKVTMDRRIGNLEKDQEFLKSRSPLFKAGDIKKPLLIAQGANDPRVKQAESDQIVSAMRSKKLPVDYLLFADEGHGFARPENRIKFYAAAEEFLAKHLGGRREPPAEHENWESVKR